MASELGLFGEEVWSELHGGSHVALDFQLALHEGSLRLDGTIEELDGILIEEGEGGIRLAFPGSDDLAIAVLQVYCPDNGWLSSLKR